MRFRNHAVLPHFSRGPRSQVLPALSGGGRDRSHSGEVRASKLFSRFPRSLERRVPVRLHLSTAEPHSPKAYTRVVHRSAMPGSLGVRAIGERGQAKFVLREYQWLSLRHGPHARRDVHLQECGRPAAPARR